MIKYNYLKNKLFNIKNLWWLVLFLFLSFPHYKNIFNSDEGVILEGAWNLINNKVLYTDFFEFVSPGSFYLVFGVWKIFGVHYFVAKLSALLFVFFSSVGTYKICQLINKGNFCYLAPIIFIVSSFHWPIINHNTFNIFFIIWAVYFFLRGLANRSIKNFVISGLLTGLSVLFLQHKGIIVLLALLLYLFIIWLKEKNLSVIKLGSYFIIFSFLPILLILIKWPAKLLYKNLIIFPLFNYIEVNKIHFYLFAFFFIFFFFVVWHLRKNRADAVWLLIFVQFFLLLSTLQRPGFYHITLILFPVYCLLPLLYKKLKTLNKGLRYLNYLIIYIAFFLIILPSAVSIAYFPPFYSIKNNKIILFIKKNCQGPYIYAGPFLSHLYFETKKLNPTPYSVLITGHQTKEQFIKAKKSLEKYQPTCAVLNYKLVEKFHHNRNNPVDNYITNNYRSVFQSGNILIYKR